jgi:hypothetical protein
MTDEEFLRALETCTLPESAFGHFAHVRAAYLYLRAEAFSGALERTRRAIHAYALHLGKSERVRTAGRISLRRSAVHSRLRISRLWVDRPINPPTSKILASANPLPPGPSIVRASMQIHSPSGLRNRLMVRSLFKNR